MLTRKAVGSVGLALRHTATAASTTSANQSPLPGASNEQKSPQLSPIYMDVQATSPMVG